MVTAVVPPHRCGAVPDSHRVPSYLRPHPRAPPEPLATTLYDLARTLSPAEIDGTPSTTETARNGILVPSKSHRSPIEPNPNPPAMLGHPTWGTDTPREHRWRIDRSNSHPATARSWRPRVSVGRDQPAPRRVRVCPASLRPARRGPPVPRQARVHQSAAGSPEPRRAPRNFRSLS